MLASQQKAPICNCGRDKLNYVCQDQNCLQKGDIGKTFYCNQCLQDGEEHQHFKQVSLENAMKSISQRWQQLKSNSLGLYNISSKFNSEFKPLIVYLNKLSVEIDVGLLARFPIKHEIYSDYQKLNAQKIKVIDITSEVEKKIENNAFQTLFQNDFGFNQFAHKLESLNYMKEINEELIYKNYGAALRDNTNTASFNEFTQQCRDSLMRLKFRAISDDLKLAPNSQINQIIEDPQNQPNSEIDNTIKALEQKFSILASNSSALEHTQFVINQKIFTQIESLNLRLEQMMKTIQDLPEKIDIKIKTCISPVQNELAQFQVDKLFSYDCMTLPSQIVSQNAQKHVEATQKLYLDKYQDVEQIKYNMEQLPKSENNDQSKNSTHMAMANYPIYLLGQKELSLVQKILLDISFKEYTNQNLINLYGLPQDHPMIKKISEYLKSTDYPPDGPLLNQNEQIFNL